ncbi:MAG: putative sugar nucleotidyl transferase [Chlorobi bacterium]|nr:putative sugar nucleotidyl transferase [Chlorobiota bacterium]
MITNIVLFEHPSHPDALYPFSVLHLPWELRYGAWTIVEAWQKLSGATLLGCYGRPNHIASFYGRYPDYRSQQFGVGRVLAASSLLLPTRHTIEQIVSTDTSKPVVFTVSNETVAVCMSLEEWSKITTDSWTELEQLGHMRQWQRLELPTARLLRYSWDLLDLSSHAIGEQFYFIADATIHHTDFLNAHVVVLGSDMIAVGSDSSIAPLVVLDASHGPIIIGSNVTIMSHATIVGPCAIGDNSIIKIGAKIYPGTVIGRWCKIGGEVECSIFHDYSNKQHDGFAGHSIIGEWVNIGADTNTSNLKNTYRPISVELLSGRVPTNRTFLGLLCGDHTKAGINTMFSTGTVVGICSNIFGAGYTPAFIPSFTWGAIESEKLYAIDTALDTARRAMARRNRHLVPEEEQLIRAEFERVTSRNSK